MVRLSLGICLPFGVRPDGTPCPISPPTGLTRCVLRPPPGCPGTGPGRPPIIPPWEGMRVGLPAGCWIALSFVNGLLIVDPVDRVDRVGIDMAVDSGLMLSGLIAIGGAMP